MNVKSFGSPSGAEQLHGTLCPPPSEVIWQFKVPCKRSSYSMLRKLVGSVHRLNFSACEGEKLVGK